MGRVTDALISLLERQVKDHGVVVWYDPDRVYTEAAEGLKMAGVEILRYQGSFIGLRQEVERHLEFVADGRILEHGTMPPRMVIYVPMDRRETRHALIEAECAGTVVEPGGTTNKNSRLRVIANAVFKAFAPHRVEKITREVEQGLHSLADLDRLAEEAGGLGSGTLELIFGRVSPSEVVLQFAATARQDPAIDSKKALPEIATLVRAEFGIELELGKGISGARADIRRVLLRTGLVACMTDGEPLKKLFLGRVPSKEEEIAAAREVCQRWRNRIDLREEYVTAAQEVDREFVIGGLDLKAEALLPVETFPFVERKLQEHTASLILKGDLEGALELAGKRKVSFWSIHEPSNGLSWSLLETASRLFLCARRVQGEVAGIKKTLPSLVGAYCESKEPWCELDMLHRHLERQYADFDVGVDEEHDAFQKIIARARQEYTSTVNTTAEQFLKALEASGFEIKSMVHQEKIFPELVGRSLSSGSTTPVAYILVDALRYEMARELMGGLESEYEIEIKPALAQIPTITEVGMAALMPGSDHGMELIEGSIGRVAIKLGEAILRDRPSRMKHLREILKGTRGLDSERVLDLKLNDIIKPTKKVQEGISQVALVIITSQEIDRRGEDAEDEDEVHHFMNEVLEKLRRGIRRLSALGVRRIVLASDHGHLFGESSEGGSRIDAPGGRTVDLHRRVWIGEGGASGPGYVRIPSSQAGLGGRLELAFPRGLACFKARGGSRAFFHGGISLQEMVIPAVVLTPRTPAARGARFNAKQDILLLSMEKKAVTTRFFTVEARYLENDLFKGEPKRVAVEVRAGKDKVGEAVAAVYGFEEGTREVLLEMGKPNVITLMLKQETQAKAISVQVIDPVSQLKLQSLNDIPLNLAV